MIGPEPRLSAGGRHVRPAIVDVHAHVFVPEADALIRSSMTSLGDALKPMNFSNASSDAVTAAMLQNVSCKLIDPVERLSDMRRFRIDMQVLSPAPNQYYYFAPPQLGLSASRLINDHIAELVREHPDGFMGLGTVPLQDPTLALAEMRRCVEDLGLRGIEVNTHVNGAELSAPQFDALFSCAAEIGAAIFLHPLGFTHGHRLCDHYLNNIVGNPLETTIALSHLIFGGTLERHPRLRILAAHGGGYLASYAGRMDHAFSVRPDCRANIVERPSDYLKRIWVDSLVYDPHHLSALVRRQGADKVCLGTDYPYDMSDPDPHGIVANLDEIVRQKVLGLNAMTLFG